MDKYEVLYILKLRREITFFRIKQYFFIFIIIVLIFTIIIISGITSAIKMSIYDLRINGNQITLKQMDKSERWISELKHEYESLIQNITFTNSILDNRTNVIGLNTGKDIFVKFTGDDEVDKNTLCHEVCHSFVETGNYDLNEKIVRDLASYGVCYK